MIKPRLLVYGDTPLGDLSEAKLEQTLPFTTSGTLTFSDGTSAHVDLPPLNQNAKTPAIVTFSVPKTGIESVRFTADTLQAGASSAGLAEFQVFGPEVDLMFRPEHNSVEVEAGKNVTFNILRNT